MHYPTAESAWVNCLHFVNITLLEVADIPSLQYFFILALLFASRIAACSLHSSKRSRLISKASLFCTKSTFSILSVGMPISAGMTASVLYVNENGVYPLLDFTMDDPSINMIHGSGSSSSTSIRVSGDSSSSRSTMKSANTCPLTDTL
ncbi:hypothetical protein Tco_0855105, partial [Tanacetum coccineum]